jgi:hypothetical protein
VVAFGAQLFPGNGANGASEVVDAVTEGVERIEDRLGKKKQAEARSKETWKATLLICSKSN